MHREVTETVFSSEVHSVRRNTSKSILDYDSPKSNRSGRLINYDSVLNSNHVEHNVAGPKSMTDLEYGLPKNCIETLVRTFILGTIIRYKHGYHNYKFEDYS